MKRHRLLAACATCLLAAPGASFGWSLAECDPGYPERQEPYRRANLGAEEGSPIYVPHPYPKAARQVFEDFRFVFRDSWRSPDRVPVEDRALALLLERRDGRYTVTRIEDWSPLRCVPRRASRGYFLLRLYAADGREAGRALLLESGQLGMYGARPADPALEGPWEEEVPDLAAARRAAAGGARWSELGLDRLEATRGLPLAQALDPSSPACETTAPAAP